MTRIHRRGIGIWYFVALGPQQRNATQRNATQRNATQRNATQRWRDSEIVASTGMRSSSGRLEDRELLIGSFQTE
jgi:hypothetical protein